MTPIDDAMTTARSSALASVTIAQRGRRRRARARVMTNAGEGRRGNGNSNGTSNEKATAPSRARAALRVALNLPTSPIGSYVSSPTSAFHRVDARVKQAWLGALLVFPASGTAEEKVATCVALALASALATPKRVWVTQLRTLCAVCAAFFVCVAIGADGVAPVVSAREPPAAYEGLGGVPELATGYRYSLVRLGPLQVTRKGINLAITSSAMTFTVLQSTHLALCVTTPEAMASGLRWYLAPLRKVRAPVDEIIFTLLLSLRFTSIVFEEARNLLLGLAARDVDWRALGWRGSVDLWGRLLARLLDSLFANASAISDAVTSRGYTDAKTHRLMLSGRTKPGLVENTIAIVGLVCFVGHFNEELVLAGFDAVNTNVLGGRPS